MIPTMISLSETLSLSIYDLALINPPLLRSSSILEVLSITAAPSSKFPETNKSLTTLLITIPSLKLELVVTLPMLEHWKFLETYPLMSISLFNCLPLLVSLLTPLSLLLVLEPPLLQTILASAPAQDSTASSNTIPVVTIPTISISLFSILILALHQTTPTLTLALLTTTIPPTTPPTTHPPMLLL